MLLVTLSPSLAGELGVEEGEPSEAVARVWERSRLGARARAESVVAVGVGTLGEVARVVAVAERDPDTTWRARPDLIDAVERLGVVVERSPYRRVKLGDQTCGCGCGGETRPGRDFLPGHDQRALHDRVKRYFGGSTLEAIRRLDEDYGDRSIGDDENVVPRR